MERYQGEALPWLIAGGINLDILARPSAAFRFRDSNPGIITERPGGVGFNMARNLTGIGSRVLFLTVLGDDRAGTVLAGRAAEAGVDLSAAIIKEGERSSRYLAVHDDEGDMAVAVNDMALFDSLTADDVTSWTRLGSPEQCCGAILDPNLPAPILASLASSFTVPLFADAVSTAKMDRLTGILPRLHGLKVNRLEAGHLTGVRVASIADAVRAVRRIAGMGISRVCLSLGIDGALFSHGPDLVLARPGRILHDGNATGAGDAMAAIFAWSANRTGSLQEVARYSVAAATLSVESDEAVNPSLSSELLSERAEEVIIEVIK